MKEMDLWVVKQATSDVRKLTNVGVYVPVSINLTAETLMDLTVMAQIEEIIRSVAGLIHIELTEESLLADEQRLTWVFNQLHQLGVKIYIDDFGTAITLLSAICTVLMSMASRLIALLCWLWSLKKGAKSLPIYSSWLIPLSWKRSSKESKPKSS